MNQEEKIFIELKKIMATILKVDVEEIDQMASMESDLREDLGIDSVESLDFITAVESLYKIKVTDQEAPMLKSVRDAVGLILKKQR